MKVPSSAYVHLKLVRARLQCLLEDPSLKYLGYLLKDLPAGAPQIPVADGRAGIVLRRSLLVELPRMLESCNKQPELRQLAALGEDILLGNCLLQHHVEMNSYMDPTEVLVEDPGLSKDRLYAGGRFSKAFSRVAEEYLDKQRQSLLKCLLLLSGLDGKDMEQIHRLIAKSKRWNPGVACTSLGMIRPSHKRGSGALKRRVLEPPVQQALKDCFFSRAYARWLSNHRGPLSHPLVLASKEALVEEWREVLPLQGKAFERLHKGGHQVCVFVLTTSASETHRADARSIYSTWAKEPRPPGVEVFVVKDNSWTFQELTGPVDTIETLPETAWNLIVCMFGLFPGSFQGG